jgi:hypothetical protein
MIGGPPVFFAPGSVTMLPPGYNAPTYGAVPYAQPPIPQPAPPVRSAQAAAPRAPVVRGQMAEEAIPPIRTFPVAMPSPDQLGVNVRPAAGACDWMAIHRRMQELGVISFQMDRLNADVFQITCLLPTAEAGRTHRIEAHGTTEADAVRCALDEAQRWKSQR